MKLIIEIPEETYKGVLELWETEKDSRFKNVIHKAIAYSKLYEERQISHEQECIIEELENICINNEYVLELLAKLKNGGRE